MITFTELSKGYDSQEKAYTVTVKLNGHIFEANAFSENERDTIYDDILSNVPKQALSP